MAKRASPSVGRNDSEPPSPETYRRAIAMVALMAEEKKKLTERHKGIRKKIEGMHVVLSDIDEAYRMKDFSEDEIISWFKRKAASLGALFSGIVEQFDIFAPKANPTDRKMAFRHIGMMAGLDGAEAKAPPHLQGADLQDWLEGHTEGAEAREQAKADFMVQAVKTAEAGGVVDGTGKGSVVDKVRAQAAADFAKDNPDAKGADGKLPGEGKASKPKADPKPKPEADPKSQSAKAAAARAEAGI